MEGNGRIDKKQEAKDLVKYGLIGIALISFIILGSMFKQDADARVDYIMNLLLSALHDVRITNPVNGDVLTYDGNFWVNGAGGGNSSGVNNTASNIGAHGQGVFAQKVLIDLQFKKLISANSGIIVTSNSTNVIFNNTRTGESTVCANLGTVGEGIYVNGNCNFKKISAGTGITLSANDTRISIASNCNNTGTGEAICESSNNINSLIASSPLSVADTTGDLTLSCATCATTTNTMQKLAQSTTSTTSSILEQNSGTNADLVCASTTFTACGEALKTSSALAGKVVNSVSLPLKRSGLATGTCTAGVMDGSANILYTFGTINSASLGTSTGLHIFTGQGTYTLSVGEYVGLKCPTQTGIIEVRISSSTTNQYDGSNSVTSNYNGAWNDNTNSDIGSATSSFAFRIDIMPYLDLTGITKKHLFLTISGYTTSASTIRMHLQFNTDGQLPLGTAYAYTGSFNGAGDGTGTSLAGCNVALGNSYLQSDSIWLDAWIDNNLSTNRKIIALETGYGAGTSSATAPTRADTVCKYDNTSSQISYIGFNKVAGNGVLDVNTIMTVWGYD